MLARSYTRTCIILYFIDQLILQIEYNKLLVLLMSLFSFFFFFLLCNFLKFHQDTRVFIITDNLLTRKKINHFKYKRQTDKFIKKKDNKTIGYVF